MLTILFNQGPARSAYNPTGGGGGGGSGYSGGAHFYIGKHKGELRRAIKSALKTLSTTKDKRKRKRVTRKIAETIASDFAFAPMVVQVREIVPLEALRIQLVRVSYEMKAAEDKAASNKLTKLLQDYEEKARKIEQQEEEAITAILLLAA